MSLTGLNLERSRFMCYWPLKSAPAIAIIPMDTQVVLDRIRSLFLLLISDHMIFPGDFVICLIGKERACSLRASSSFRVFSKGSRACYRGGSLVPNARDFSRYPPDAELARRLARIKRF